MQARPIIILTFLFQTIYLSGLGQADTVLFASKIDLFLQSKSAEYITINQTKYTTGNNFALDTKINSNWKKTITLKAKTSFINKYKQRVYPRLYFSFYQFRDSIDCNNAKTKLLSCLGGGCAIVNWNDNDASIKSPPFIYVFNSNQIISCFISCEHTSDDWENIKRDIVDRLGTSETKTIELKGCGGKLTFSN